MPVAPLRGDPPRHCSTACGPPRDFIVIEHLFVDRFFAGERENEALAKLFRRGLHALGIRGLEQRLAVNDKWHLPGTTRWAGWERK